MSWTMLGWPRRMRCVRGVRVNAVLLRRRVGKRYHHVDFLLDFFEHDFVRDGDAFEDVGGGAAYGLL